MKAVIEALAYLDGTLAREGDAYFRPNKLFIEGWERVRAAEAAQQVEAVAAAALEMLDVEITTARVEEVAALLRIYLPTRDEIDPGASTRLADKILADILAL